MVPLQEHCKVVGDYLLTELRKLQEKHDGKTVRTKVGLFISCLLSYPPTQLALRKIQKVAQRAHRPTTLSDSVLLGAKGEASWRFRLQCASCPICLLHSSMILSNKFCEALACQLRLRSIGY